MAINMSSLRYKYICTGLIVLSLTWALVIFFYVAYLERTSKNELAQKREHIRIWGQPKFKNSVHKLISDRSNQKDDIYDENVVVFKKKVRKNDQMIMNDFDDVQISDQDDKAAYHDPKKLLKDQENRNNNNNQEDQVEFQRQKIVNRHENNDMQVVKPKSVLDLDQLAVIHGEEDQKMKDFAYRRFAFNGLISDRIGEEREIPDVRHQLCKAQVYPSSLPKASIIICYHQESLSVLIRMVNSILHRTPKILIEEILVIDDFSDLGEMQIELQKYADKHWPVKLVKLMRTESRLGLINAKNFGSRLAKGDVLVFLDSHCEVNQQWLEPLLARIKENRKRFVCPIIDIIDSDTFKYVEAPVCVGGFNWGLSFLWEYPDSSYFKSTQDYIKPLRSPTMAGGLFAVDRQYFKEIGEYDPGMKVWGAENVEISIRIWTCGGELEVVPCSRVAHIFRKRRPYGDPDNVDSFSLNAVRTAKVWLDDYVEDFFKQTPSARSVDAGDISDRVALRKQLQCKPFDWYLQNVYQRLAPAGLIPQNATSLLGFVPRDQPHAKEDAQTQEVAEEELVTYRIKLSNSEWCLGPAKHDLAKRGAQIGLDQCDAHKKMQRWRKTAINELRLGKQLCLDANKNLRLMKCDGQGAFQEWKMKDSKLFNPATGKCLVAERLGPATSATLVVKMGICDTSVELAKWDLINIDQ